MYYTFIVALSTNTIPVLRYQYDYVVLVYWYGVPVPVWYVPVNIGVKNNIIVDKYSTYE